MTPKLYIGTAGWSYKDWVPSFYPLPQSKTFDWLQFYSQYFNVVEVNSTYYAYTSQQIINGWIKKVEEIEDFSFTIKLHQDFTHKKDFDDDKIKSVCNNLDLLEKSERLGGLLLQFPYSFSCNNANISYLTKLLEVFENYVKFVEVRHTSWNNKEAFDFLQQHNTSLCTIDQPKIGSSIQFKPLITNNTAYIRFHGRNAEAWKNSINNFGAKQTYEQQSERYNYLYTPGELVQISQQIKEIYDKVKKIFVIMNNHPVGNAVANAFELLHLLKEKAKLKIPETTLKVYPRLIAIKE
ncbi:MAG: DUF72 domain-containing protein [Ignavibacteriales bacterium]|nr:DUF72 domain-containing protein [Ignavibacteriales bacterium]